MHKWIALSLFPRADIRVVLNAELRILYAMVHKIKMAPVRDIIRHMQDSIRFSTAICCTSLVTRIANGVKALERKNVTYIPTPRFVITEQSMVAGHHLRTDHAGNLVYFFPGYINELPLPNPAYSLYKSPSLTFTLVEQEEERRSSVSRRFTRRHEEASSSHATPPPSTWTPEMPVPGFTFAPGYGYIPSEAGGSGMHTGDTSSSEGLPPPRRSVSDRRTMDNLSTRLGAVELRTGEIQNTLNTYVQDSTAWQQQTQANFTNINEMLRRNEEATKAYWRYMGYNPNA